MIKTVPVVRGVAPLVDLAAPDVEALGLVPRLGGADGRDGEAKRLQPGHSGRQWAAPQPGGR